MHDLLKVMSALLLLLVMGMHAVRAEEEVFNLDAPVDEAALVQVPEPPSAWRSIGAPLGLTAAMFFLLWLNKVTVPFKTSKINFNLHHFPTGAKRGLALAIILFGVAYCGGAAEIYYQLHVNGSAEQYFQNMSTGKLIAISHVHLFGWVTTFLMIGIPFSMQFSHLRAYQWLLPVGLAASITDLVAWWGIKFIHINFEYVSVLCGLLFAFSYLYMLIAMLRVLLFPHLIWFSDKDGEERRKRLEQSRLRRTLDRLLTADLVKKEDWDKVI